MESRLLEELPEVCVLTVIPAIFKANYNTPLVIPESVLSKDFEEI